MDGPHSGALSSSVSCQVSCQPPIERKAPTWSCHVRDTSGTSWHAGTQHVGARAGSRTLNLGIKRRLTVLVRKRQDVLERASRTWRSDAFLSQSVLTCHSVPRVRCQQSCQTWSPRGSNSLPLRQTPSNPERSAPSSILETIYKPPGSRATTEPTA